MRYMLDTNICVYLIRKKPISVIHRLQALKISDVCVSSVTLAELEYGVAKSRQPEQNRWAFTEFLAPLDIMVFDDSAAREYGILRFDLERSGKTVGAMDMLIAAHALSMDMTLVTNDASEFRQIEALPMENWV